MKKNIKLWEKDHTKTNSFIESFTVGNDKEFDLLLAKHDVKC
jgi:argininosuccinate lyase